MIDGHIYYITNMTCFKIQAIYFLTILVHLHRSFAFIHCNQIQKYCQQSYETSNINILHASNTDGVGESDDDEEETSQSAFALPAIGSSSFWDKADGSNTSFDTSDLTGNKNGIVISNEYASVVSKKFKIQYTCKKCDTRNEHSVTRLAYRKGVVIAQCKGCFTKHWLADNLGWSNHIGGFDFDSGERNIEQYMANKSQELVGSADKKENDVVKRVSQEVFDLESVFYKGKEGQMDDMSTNKGKKVDQDGDNMNMSWS